MFADSAQALWASLCFRFCSVKLDILLWPDKKRKPEEKEKKSEKKIKRKKNKNQTAAKSLGMKFFLNKKNQHTVEDPLTTSQLNHTEMFTPAADHIIQLQKSTQKCHNGVLR